MWKRLYSEEEVEYVACPLCGESEALNIGVEWSLVVAQCVECSMRYVKRRAVGPGWNPLGDEDGLVSKYDSRIRGEEPHPRERNYGQMLDMIDPFRGEAARLLDVGAHLGFFMRLAARRGWDVVGIEPFPALAEAARTHMDLDVRTGYLEEFGFDSEFDAATFVDVLEHVPNPLEVLIRARQAVRPGGVVLVKVPSGKWNRLKYLTVKKVLGDRVDSLDTREHLNQFTAGTLKDAFRRAGLDPVKLFIPYPVQNGGPVRRTVRWSLFRAGNGLFNISGDANALCPDLGLIGMRPR
jgi:2-polyprenyl-3-methyl-5-hydroxy-6-metoxy-1,4-benzoquinol methylase